MKTFHKKIILFSVFSLALLINNNISLGQSPEYVSSSVEDAAPADIVAIFSDTVTSTDTSGFIIEVNTIAATISNFAGSGTDTLTFTLSTPVVFGDIVTIEYDGSGDADCVIFGTDTVTNNVAQLSSETDILTYSFAEQTGAANIDTATHTVEIEVVYGTNLTALVATFTLSAGASAEVSGVPQVSGVTANDFTSPVTYTIIAEDSTTQDWLITVTEYIPNSENDIISFGFPEQIGAATINAISHTVDVEVSSWADITSLVGIFTLSPGASAEVGGVPQVSGVTVNDFTYPVVYNVIAEDATQQSWIVTVTVPSAETDITAYSFPEQTGAATIDTAAHTIALEVANGTDLATLVATFTLSEEATAKVGAVTQVSGITSNNFTNVVTYTVTAEDGTTQDWLIDVKVKDVNPPTITTQPFDRTLCVIYSIDTFTVKVKADTSAYADTINDIAYQWMKDGVALTGGGATTEELKINVDTTDDAGGYYCVVRHSGYNVTSDTAILTVNPLPVVDIGGDISGVCDATLIAGEGYINYDWSKFINNQWVSAISTNHLLYVTENGKYHVAVTDSNGCIGVSNDVTVNLLSSL